MTRRRTRNNLPYEVQELRRLLKDNGMSIAELADITGLPVERMRTLTRGNAPMRVNEASRIALAFGLTANVFLEKEGDTRERSNQYVLAHRGEIQKFQETLETALSLRDSFKKFSDSQAHRSAPPKDCYYDGSMGEASRIVAKETLLTDRLFSAVEYLNGKDTILLAGSKDFFLTVATRYMHRWWDERVQPGDITKVKLLVEPEEKERCNQYRELRAAFYRSEAFSDSSFNPGKIELDHMLAKSMLKNKPASLRQAEELYYRSLTNLKKYEYFRFVQALMKLSSKKGTIFGDSLKERLTILKQLRVIRPNVMRANMNVLEIKPIQAGYNTTTHEMSDTELARIILSNENAEFTWYFSYEGHIVASDGLTVVSKSIEELATCMRQQSFFAGDTANHSTGIIWENIPHGEKEFTAKLGLEIR